MGTSYRKLQHSHVDTEGSRTRDNDVEPKKKEI
jgi:hypothetical protein